MNPFVSHLIVTYQQVDFAEETVLSALEQYPWKETGGSTPLAGPLMERFRRDLRIGAWNGSGALYGTRAQVAEARRLLRRALAGKATGLQFLDDRKLAAAQTSPPFPLILGGHEHKVFLEEIERTWIIKAGTDAAFAAVVDLEWPAEAPATGEPSRARTTPRTSPDAPPMGSRSAMSAGEVVSGGAVKSRC